MITAEDVILKTLGLKTILENSGVYDEVVDAMETYARTKAEKLPIHDISDTVCDCDSPKPDWMYGMHCMDCGKEIDEQTGR